MGVVMFEDLSQGDLEDLFDLTASEHTADTAGADEPTVPYPCTDADVCCSCYGGCY